MLSIRDIIIDINEKCSLTYEQISEITKILLKAKSEWNGECPNCKNK